MHRYLSPSQWIPEKEAQDYDYNYSGALSEYLSRFADVGGKYGIIIDHPGETNWHVDNGGEFRRTIVATRLHIVEPPLEPLTKWIDEEPAREELRPLVIDAMKQLDNDVIHQTKDDEFLRILLQCFGFDDARTARPASIQVYAPLGEPMSIDLISSDMDPIYEYVARVDIVVHLPNHRDIEYIYDGEEYLDIIRDEPIDVQPA